MPRPLCLLPLVALAFALMPTAGAAARHGCPSTGVVKRTSEALVFKRAQRTGPDLYYGCARRYRSTYRLNGRGDYGTTFVHERTLRLAGHVAVYEEDYLSGAGGETNVVTVKSLRTGRVVHDAQVSRRGGDLSDAVTAVVAKRNGSVAWIASAEGGYEARLMDTTTRRTPRLLDAGPAIEPGSLALSAARTTVYWRVAGQMRSAPIR